MIPTAEAIPAPPTGARRLGEQASDQITTNLATISPCK